ncbi:response regulator transcription factor [Bacillus gobiensis]|uniref:response regulator transcription factor n=1 Tax=Bacillus gobiensis TaxID=1441095 RepID=UPI003D1FFA27
MATILVVDDDQHIRELVSTMMTQSGFSVIEANDGKQAIDRLADDKVDLMIVDVMMPYMDGFEVSKAVRDYTDLPILMLTAKGETIDKVRGLAVGADDYLVKPFEPLELEARVKALLRRYHITTVKQLKIGTITLYEDSHSATNEKGEIFNLPRREFELLYKLASYPKKTFSREQLIDDIWGFEFEGDERTVDVHVKRLREKFPEPAVAFSIRTIRGLGYRLEISQ